MDLLEVAEARAVSLQLTQRQCLEAATMRGTDTLARAPELAEVDAARDPGDEGAARGVEGDESACQEQEVIELANLLLQSLPS